MKPLLFAAEPDLPLAPSLCRDLPAEQGRLEYRRFPDGESYLRIHSDVQRRPCLLLANLTDPDRKYLPLVYLAATLRELGATAVGLVAPYLCYMRQDRRFNCGEALTSRLFAERLSREVDWLVTVDPHLHRYRSLAEIYSVPARALSAAPALAHWLTEYGEPCLLVGPDSESRQWIEAIAAHTGLPFIIGRKQRRGDRDVSVELPAAQPPPASTQRAVIVDDVISSGHTVLQTAAQLRHSGFTDIDCLAVHGLLAEGAAQRLYGGGVKRLVTTNGISGEEATIDLSPLLLDPIRDLLNG